MPVVIADAGSHIALRTESLAVYGWNYDHHDKSWVFSDQASDYIFADSFDMKVPLPDSKGVILPSDEWLKTKMNNHLGKPITPTWGHLWG